MPDGETKEMFFKGISTPRNKELMRVLSDLKYVEQTGYGVPEVLKHYDKNVFDIEENYINVSIPYDPEVMASMHVTDAGAENGAENGADNNLEEKIIRELKTNSKITRKELSSKLQIGTTSVYRILNRLKEKKKIRRVGPDKGGHWEIID